jgi:hypothetical protein
MNMSLSLKATKNKMRDRRKSLIERSGVRDLFSSRGESDFYQKNAFMLVLRMASVLALPSYCLESAFWIGWGLHNIGAAAKRVAELLLCILHPFLLKPLFMIIKWLGKLKHALTPRVAGLVGILANFFSILHHWLCETIAGWIIAMAGCPPIVFVFSRIWGLLRQIKRPLAFAVDIVRLMLLYIKLPFAGRASLFSLFFVAFRAASLHLKPSEDIRRQYFAMMLSPKPYCPDYRHEPMRKTSALYSKPLPKNEFAALLEKADRVNALSEELFYSAQNLLFSAEEIIETLATLRRCPNPAAMPFLVQSLRLLKPEQALPRNSSLKGILAEKKYFGSSPLAIAPGFYIILVPITRYDIERVRAGKLCELLYSMAFLSNKSTMRLCLILPAQWNKNQNDELEIAIRHSLSDRYMPDSVEWEIIKQDSEFQGGLANYRGMQMLYGLRYVCENDLFCETAHVVLTEFNLSTPMANLCRMSQRLGALNEQDAVIAGSRYSFGAKALNKSRITHIYSQAYNAYARFLIPKNPSADSSSPLKLTTKRTIKKMLSGLTLCESGMLDFTFDEGFLSVAAATGIKVINAPLFWYNILGRDAARRTALSRKNQLKTTRMLSKKIRLYENILRDADKKIKLGAGMDFTSYIDGSFSITKLLNRPLNRLEILIASWMKKDVNHNRFGILGRLIMKFLPGGISKRIGRIVEGIYRDPTHRLPYLIARADSCRVIAPTRLVSADTRENNFFECRQDFSGIELSDLLDYQIRYQFADGVKSILYTLLGLNKTLIEHGMFDKDIRSLFDVGVFTTGSLTCRYLDFADFVTSKKHAVDLLKADWLNELYRRKDFMAIAKTCMGRREFARVYRTWLKDWQSLLTPQSVDRLWDLSSKNSPQLPLLISESPCGDGWRLRQCVLLETEGIPRMKKEWRERYVSCLPGFTRPCADLIKEKEAKVFHPAINAKPEDGNIMFLLTAHKHDVEVALQSFMEQHMPYANYKIIKDAFGENVVAALNFKRISENYLNDNKHLVIIPLDGASSRMQPILNSEYAHKSLFPVKGKPLLYWILSSCFKALQNVTDNPLVLYLHGDTLPVFDGMLTGNAVFIDKRVYKALKAKKYARTVGETGIKKRVLARLLAGDAGFEFPAAFCVCKKHVPELRETSLKHSFWHSVAHMLGRLPVECREMEMFIDMDSADDLFLLHLLSHNPFVGNRLAHDKVDVRVLENVYIGENARVFISTSNSVAVAPCTVSLSNFVVDDNAVLSIIIEADVKEVFIQRVVCTKSDASISLRSNRMENLLLANCFGEMLAPEPWSYCGGNKLWHPLFPAFTPFIRNMAGKDG